MRERDALASDKSHILEEKERAELEFGKIRAKFKDLYLQRESDIIKLEEDKMMLETEIADTRAAALLSQSTAQEELDMQMRRYNEETRQYKIQLRDSHEQATKVRNATAQDNENLEHGMVRAQKDSHMLREIIVPLETELRELKEQCTTLMSENMRLRQGQEQRPQPTVDMLLDLCDDVNAGAEIAVEDNSTTLLVQEQETNANLTEQISSMEDKLRTLTEQQVDYKSRDSKLSQLFTEAQDECSSKVTELEELKRSVQTTETKWSALTTEITENITLVTDDFNALREAHEQGQGELVGLKERYHSALEELDTQRDRLNEELEKVKLKLSDERKTHEDAQALLTDSLESCRKEILRLEGVSLELQTSRELNEKMQNDVLAVTDKLNESQRKSKEVILALQKQILSTGALKEEQDARIARLGKELSESLSVRDELAIQSSELQVQLVNTRELLNTIHWEHEDDVTNCRSCDVTFSMTKRKSHCRKCGRIFCQECCSRGIEVNRRVYKACEECSTRFRAQQPAEYHTVTVPRG